MLFFADGQLIFSTIGKFAYTPPIITMGAGLGVSHLAMLAAPRVGLSYNDGSSRQRQVHQLYGADCRVSEKIFDSLDRLVATTRVAPGSFKGGASFAPLQYRASFVDVQDFLKNFKSTGVMTGDVAAYYAGQSENGVVRSNDQQYPYYGTLWESSPRRRRIEHGLPGKPYAVADLGTTTPIQRATTQYAYGSNTAGSSPLPAGKYARTAVTTPLKSTAVSFQDQRGQSVGTWQFDTAGTPTVQSAGLRTYAQTPAGLEATFTAEMPNAMLTGPQSDNAAFVRTTLSNGAGKATSSFDPNAGQSQFLYDPCGRVRFVQPALDPGEQWFLYNKYDALGRLVEQGTLPHSWQPQTLESLAANMDWPDASLGPTITFLWSYDGDGGTAAQIGQRTSCVTSTEGPLGPCITTEVFTYDPAGRLADVAMSVSASFSASGTTSYAYNNLGELTVLTQPAGSPLKQIFYTINDQGWITAIGSTPNALDSIASYRYTVDGNVETESLGGKWIRSAQYSSPGWIDQVITKSSDSSQSLSLKYTYNANSTIATRTIDYAFAAMSGSLADTYTYDGQGRLKNASGSSNDQVTSYDPNGNIWGVTQGGKAQSFPCIAGKDQLSQTQVSDHNEPVKYDARGRMTSGLARTLTYDNTTNLTISGSIGSTVVQFGYGSHGQRILKMATGGSSSASVYFTGASPLPIAKLEGKVWSAMVYGPTGLVAIVSDQTYYPLKDRQQSVWAVVSSAGLAARYVYLPFGAVVADGPNPEICAYRFMGQEWDAELSLCNFRARMYDPVLRRFLVPDMARQFPSPYVFCGNNPLNATDPSGNSSLWARIGIGLGMALTVLAGVAVSLVTLGAAAPAAAAADAAAVGAGVGGEAAAGIAAGVEAGTEGAAAAAASGEGAAVGEGSAAVSQAAAEGGASEASEVGSGVAVGDADGGAGAAPAAAASSGWVTAGNLGVQVLAGTVQGAGTSGLQYDIQHNRDFTVGGFFESVGWGAVGGALGAGFAGPLAGFSASIEALGKLTQFGITVGVNGVAGAASSAVTSMLSNLADHQPWDQGVWMSIGIGLGEGVALTAFGEGIKGSKEIAKVGEETLQKLNSGIDTMVDRVLAAARTQEGTGVLMVGGFFTVAGLLVGGVAGMVKLQNS
jgi:RHS repeat-associated protein